MIRMIALLILVAAGPAWAQDQSPSPDGAQVYFITPADGDMLKSPVTVRFGLKGMGVAPAGTDKPGTGHHHLIIDAPLPDLSFAVPKDDHYRHFGGGQTEVTLELAPGTHSLQLLLGDRNHLPHQPPLYSEPITITVE